jgi:hypothetical protein
MRRRGVVCQRQKSVACEDFCPAGFEILRLHPALVLRVAAREDNTSWCARGSATYIELSLIVSSAINAMSTVQAAQTANHSPLFDLPRELRDLIYEQVFADLISDPLYIRRIGNNPQWRVCYDPHARVPGLLLTSKVIYSESKSCLYNSCNPPRIVIDDHAPLHWESIPPPEECFKRCGFAIRDLETIIPILTTVEELNLDIQDSTLSITLACMLLVRWIRAVLNVRETHLRKASVRLRASVNWPPHIGNTMRDVCKEAARIKTQNRPLEEIWLLKRRIRDASVGPLYGMAWEGRHAIQAEALDLLSCDVAWRDLTEREIGAG